MTHGSLFSGIGGFDLAAEWMGWENIFHCEINPFCQKVLKHHFPYAESLTDITKTDFSKYNGTIDIISGGFPCQPYSVAGKRKGKEDERHLWPEMLRAIREVQPRWVVGENVFGLVNWSGGLVFHEVQTDLEAEGYEVFPYVLPACAVNAPHRRDRVWFIAHSASERLQKSKKSELKKQLFDAERDNLQYAFTNSNGNGCNGSNGEHEINTSEERQHALNDFEHVATTYPNSQRRCSGNTGWKDAIHVNPCSENDGHRRLFERFPTQSPLCGRNDGVPDRVDRIKALGNAIVPQVAFEIFKAIEQTELNFFAPDPTF